MGIEALDKLLTTFIKTKIADKDGDGQLSKAEESLFTYSPAGKDLADALKFKTDDKYDAIDWIKVNETLEAHDFSQESTDLDIATSQIMMSIDKNGDGDILDELGSIDTDKDGVISAEEIKKASDANVNVKNMLELFAEDIKTDKDNINNIFSFENMQRYTQLVNVGNDEGDNNYTISEGEAVAFGTLLTSKYVNISGKSSAITSADLAEAVRTYINKGTIAGKAAEIIEALKDGNLSVKEAKKISKAEETWILSKVYGKSVPANANSVEYDEVNDCYLIKDASGNIVEGIKNINFAFDESDSTPDKLDEIQNARFSNISKDVQGSLNNIKELDGYSAVSNVTYNEDGSVAGFKLGDRTFCVEDNGKTLGLDIIETIVKENKGKDLGNVSVHNIFIDGKADAQYLYFEKSGASIDLTDCTFAILADNTIKVIDKDFNVIIYNNSGIEIPRELDASESDWILSKLGISDPDANVVYSAANNSYLVEDADGNIIDGIIGINPTFDAKTTDAMIANARFSNIDKDTLSSENHIIENFGFATMIDIIYNTDGTVASFKSGGIEYTVETLTETSITQTLIEDKAAVVQTLSGGKQVFFEAKEDPITIPDGGSVSIEDDKITIYNASGNIIAMYDEDGEEVPLDVADTNKLEILNAVFGAGLAPAGADVVYESSTYFIKDADGKIIEGLAGLGYPFDASIPTSDLNNAKFSNISKDTLGSLNYIKNAFGITDATEVKYNENGTVASFKSGGKEYIVETAIETTITQKLSDKVSLIQSVDGTDVYISIAIKDGEDFDFPYSYNKDEGTYEIDGATIIFKDEAGNIVCKYNINTGAEIT